MIPYIIMFSSLSLIVYKINSFKYNSSNLEQQKSLFIADNFGYLN